ncbi:MAG: protein-glutamine glutaminase family protein [Candidatus Eremiobacteraeota bacterium]|nr:protein-glutamine glutaminase family protein [Candidatus Eremiobacteraeota bacterium]
MRISTAPTKILPPPGPERWVPRECHGEEEISVPGEHDSVTLESTRSLKCSQSLPAASGPENNGDVSSEKQGRALCPREESLSFEEGNLFSLLRGKGRPQGINAPGAADIRACEESLAESAPSMLVLVNRSEVTGLDGEVPSAKALQKAFLSVAGEKSIPWEYLPDGCYARAHAACDMIMKKGYNCGKLFISVADDGDGWNSFKAQGKFTAGAWWYHVAALSFAADESSGEVKAWVIDPAVNPAKPLAPDEWLASFWDGTFPVNADLTYADEYGIPFHDAISPPGPREFSREAFEKNLFDARRVNRIYLKALKQIKDGYRGNHQAGQRAEGALAS